MELKIKLSSTDKLFSRERRLMADGICDVCHRKVGLNKLQVMHFHSRRKRSVRWDRQNVAVGCFGCHQRLDSEPLEKVEFFRGRMNNIEFDLLNARALKIRKWTPAEIKELEADLKDKISRLE